MQRTVLLLCFLFLSSTRAQHELLSARCQAKCLADFESQAEVKGLVRRQLKHSIVSLCQNDSNCSSCANPCREAFQSAQHCIDIHCKEAGSKVDCYKSCLFMKEIFTYKPGQCSKIQLKTAVEECVSSCGRDGDCPQAMKCCSNGCGRSCAVPERAKIDLMPVPVQVTASERKRGRSAVVRWESKSESGSTSFASLYMVQWRWGIRSNGGSMTPWQTISVRNKDYAILKHLLSPGRYYSFRVAAVDQHGSQGFSAPSQPFKLSKDPKAPGKPRSVELGKRELKVDGSISQEIHWLEPSSDLPIVNYQVSWSLAEVSGQNSTYRVWQNDMPLKGMDRRNSESFVDSDKVAFGHTYWTELVPAGMTLVRLHSLLPNATYFVEIHAIVQAEHEQMQGEKAALLLPTALGSELVPQSTTVRVVPSTVIPTTTTTQSTMSTKGLTTPSTPLTTSTSTSTPKATPQSVTINNLRVHKPYFQNGQLKTMATWNVLAGSIQPDSDLQFTVVWLASTCRDSSHNAHVFASSAQVIQSTRVTELELYDLQFGCHYLVQVSSAAGNRLNGTFETALCEDTQVIGDVTPSCANQDFKRDLRVQNLNCAQPSNVGLRANVWQCVWDAPEQSEDIVIGYRVLAGVRLTAPAPTGTHLHHAIDRQHMEVHVLKQNERHFELRCGMNEAQIVQVQALSKTHVGAAVYVVVNDQPIMPTNNNASVRSRTSSTIGHQEHLAPSQADSTDGCSVCRPSSLAVVFTFITVLYSRCRL